MERGKVKKVERGIEEVGGVEKTGGEEGGEGGEGKRRRRWRREEGKMY